MSGELFSCFLRSIEEPDPGNSFVGKEGGNPKRQQ
jgi:hypothetical protein